MIVRKVFAVQAMQAADPGVGIEDILPGDAIGLCLPAFDQAEDLLVQLLPLVLGDGFMIIRLFHGHTSPDCSEVIGHKLAGVSLVGEADVHAAVFEQLDTLQLRAVFKFPQVAPL